MQSSQYMLISSENSLELNCLTFTVAHVPRLQHRPNCAAAMVAINRTRRSNIVLLRYEVMTENYARLKEILIWSLTQLLHAQTQFNQPSNEPFTLIRTFGTLQHHQFALAHHLLKIFLRSILDKTIISIIFSNIHL